MTSVQIQTMLENSSIAPKHDATYPAHHEATEEDKFAVLVAKAIGVIRSENKASIALIQRRLVIGYTLASRIMDALEQRGIVAPGEPGGPTARKIINLPTAQ